MRPIHRSFRRAAVATLTAFGILLTAAAVPLVAANPASAATTTPVPTSDIINRAVDEAKKQGVAQDYTQPITKPRWKILTIAFSDVTYTDGSGRKTMDADERTYAQTVSNQMADVLEKKTGIQVTPTIKFVTDPVTVTSPEGIHEGDVLDYIKKLAAPAEYDVMIVTSKGGNGGGLTGPRYYSDEYSQGSSYTFLSFSAPTSSPGYPGLTSDLEFRTIVALHELGHVMSHNGQGFPYPDLHNAGAYGYTPDPKLEYAPFYFDYLTGKVKVNGVGQGTYPKMWTVSQRFLHRPAMATVHYQNTAGQTIAPDANAYGPGGESYAIKAPSIAGYSSVSLKSDSAPASGEFVTGTNTDITFVYSTSQTDVRFVGGQTVDLYGGGTRGTGALYTNSYTYKSAVPVTGYTYADRIVSMGGARRGDLLYGSYLNLDAKGTATLSKDGNTYTAVKKSDTLVEVSVTLAQPVSSFALSNLSYGNIAPTGHVHQTLQVLSITPAVTGRNEPMTAPVGHTTLSWGDYRATATFVDGGTTDVNSAESFAPGAVHSGSYTYRATVPVTGFTYTDTLTEADGVKRIDTLDGSPITWNASGAATVKRDGNTYTVVKKSDTLVEISVAPEAPSTDFTMLGIGHTNSAPTGRATRTLRLVDVTLQHTATKQAVADTTPKGNTTMTWGDYKKLQVPFYGGGTADTSRALSLDSGYLFSTHYHYQAAAPVTGYTYTDSLTSTDGVGRRDSLFYTKIAWDASGVGTLSRDGNSYTVVKKSDTETEITVVLGKPSAEIDILGVDYTNYLLTGRATESLGLVAITPESTGKSQAVTAPRGNMTLTWGNYKAK